MTDVYFPFIQLNAIYGSSQLFAEESDDGTTGFIQIGPGFPFGNSTQRQFYVCKITIAHEMVYWYYVSLFSFIIGGDKWTPVFW